MSNEYDELAAVWRYVRKALSPKNRIPFDGTSNYRYLPTIRLAEVGPGGGLPGGFLFDVTIPRQMNNELGLSLRACLGDRKEAAAFLRRLADEVEGKT